MNSMGHGLKQVIPHRHAKRFQSGKCPARPDDRAWRKTDAHVFDQGQTWPDFHPEYTYVPMKKQLRMMDSMLYLYKKSKELIENGRDIDSLLNTNIFEKVIKIKYDVKNDEFTFLAGEKYRKFLIPELSNVKIPMKGLKIGKQLQWLTKQNN